MSYIRNAWPLRWFKDESHEYVFPSANSKSKDFVEDYGSKFIHKPSFIEMIGNILLRETGDIKWTEKIVRILAKDYGIDHLLRSKRLGAMEMFRQMDRKSRKLMKELEDSL